LGPPFLVQEVPIKSPTILHELKLGQKVILMDKGEIIKAGYSEETINFYKELNENGETAQG
jgi:ABC-type polysaccharide/polyol phosphate transport system ATPase subunit